MKLSYAGFIRYHHRTSIILLAIFLITTIHAADFPDYYYPDSSMCVYGSVRALLFYNGTLYAGGNFREVTGANGTFERRDIAAFDVATGNVTEFIANTDRGTIRTITADAGNLFFGGSFNSVNDQPRSKIAAVDPVTGEVLQSFRPGGGNIEGSVWVMAASDRTLVIGGSFTSVDNVPRTNLAALNSENGMVLEHFNVIPGDPMDDSGKTPEGVYALEVHPENPEIIFVGGNFRNINGDYTRSYLTSVKIDGSLGPHPETAPRSPVIDLDARGTLLCAAVGGISNRLVAFSIGSEPYRRCWKSLRVHGDVQAVAITAPGFVYFGFHDGLYDSINDDYRLAVLNGNSGDIYDAYPLMNSFFGVRALDASDECLAAGGDFTEMNGKEQQHLALFRTFPFSFSDRISLGVPELFYPPHTEWGVDCIPQFEWEAVVRAEQYELQVSTDTDFTAPAIHEEHLYAANYSSGELSSATTYWWRVRAKKGNETGEWSLPFKFITRPEKQDIPFMVSPLNGAYDLPVTITFRWHPTSSAVAYRVQLAGDPLFEKLLVDSGTGTDTSLTLSSLNNTTEYYWRLNAMTLGGATGWRSGVFSTIIGTPEIPQGVEPSDNARQVPLKQRLAWRNVRTAKSYRLLVAMDSNFTELLYDSTGLRDTVFTLENLSEDTRYYWRVVASNRGGAKSSLPMKFTTVYPFPGSPVPVVPEMNFIFRVRAVKLQWNKCTPYVNSYRVEIAEDSLLTRIIIDTMVETTEIITSGLDDRTDFWWRVTAVNETGWGEVSVTRRFKTRYTTEKIIRTSLDRVAFIGNTGTVYFNIKEKNDVKLALFDLGGKRVWSSIREALDPGEHRTFLDISEFPTGMYLFFLRSGNYIAHVQTVLVR